MAKHAGFALPANRTDFEVVETVKGNATTDFGAPGVPAKDEARPMSDKGATRMVELLASCWTFLDGVVAKAPEELVKGPRGGGRDRDKMFDHVLGAEMEYAKRIGIRLKQPDGRDRAAVRAFRRAMLDGVADPNREDRWPVAYFVRRTAWHALDHAWEIEDRSKP